MDDATKKISILRELFPECRDDAPNATLDFDALRRAIDELEERARGAAPRRENERDRYAFLWRGKERARELAFERTQKIAAPAPEESKRWDRTQNLYIEGDNLDALKLLMDVYEEQVDLIYVDPPYNSGNAFVYNDDYSVARAEKGGRGGRDAGEEQDRRHSAWRSMIFSRALLARKLLAPSGVFLASIDDREIANALPIFDEVFGEDRRVAIFVWETKLEPKGMPPKSMCARNHEYVLAYAKGDGYRFQGVERALDGTFANPDGDPRGPWKRQYLQRFGQGFPLRKLVDPASGAVYEFETPYSEETMARLAREGRVVFPTPPNRFPMRKEFFAEYANPRKPILSSLGLYSTKSGSEELKKLFDGVKVFDYPKPLPLIMELLRRGLDRDGLALDFFSGSATTAHAVMALNAEDGGKRRFIVAQSPDPCAEKSVAYRAGFRTISDVGKERLRRAGEMIEREMAERGAVDPALDVGFRVYRIVDRRTRSTLIKGRNAGSTLKTPFPRPDIRELPERALPRRVGA